jgi:hypothetical protein
MKTLVLLLGFMPALVLAEATVLMSWEAPTERENGETLTMDELASYEAECGGETVLTLDDGAATSAEVALAFGRHDCRIRVTDTDGLVSRWSDTVTVVVNASPGSPRILDFGRL